MSAAVKTTWKIVIPLPKLYGRSHLGVRCWVWREWWAAGFLWPVSGHCIVMVFPPKAGDGAIENTHTHTCTHTHNTHTIKRKPNSAVVSKPWSLWYASPRVSLALVGHEQWLLRWWAEDKDGRPPLTLSWKPVDKNYQPHSCLWFWRPWHHPSHPSPNTILHPWEKQCVLALCCLLWTPFSPWASLVAQTVKNPPAMREIQVQSPGLGRLPWRRKWQPTPVFLPGESHG